MNKFDKIIYIIFLIVLTFSFIKISLLLLLVLILLCFFRTWQMNHEPNQKEFLQGKLPNPKPDGFYQGSTGFKTSWAGKKFDAALSRGINVFSNDKGVKNERYPFITSVDTGLFDKNIFVLKIDYNIKGNPFWMRSILDEIVEIAPNEYLGKMHLRIIPGFPFSVLYFELKK